MKRKEGLYAVARGLIAWFEREWKNRQALWLAIAVLIFLLLQFQILESINEINREFVSMEYKLRRMEERMGLIAEQVGVSSSDWGRGGFRRRW